MVENATYIEQVKGIEAIGQSVQASAAIEAIEQVLPVVKPALQASEFGRDALAKATGILERSRVLTTTQDLNALRTVNDSLARTLNMFNSVASRVSGS